MAHCEWCRRSSDILVIPWALAETSTYESLALPYTLPVSRYTPDWVAPDEPASD